MRDTARRESPLGSVDGAAARALDGPVRIAERPFLGHVNLRGDARDAQFASAVQGVLEFPLPTVPNTIAECADAIAFWLGPDEWLLVTTREPVTLVAALRAALASVHAAVTDVSSGQTLLELRGAGVRDLLAQECPLDLHPRGFAAGQCAQTRLAKAAVLLCPRADDAVDLIVRRSFADYLWRWFSQATHFPPMEVP